MFCGYGWAGPPCRSTVAIGRGLAGTDFVLNVELRLPPIEEGAGPFAWIAGGEHQAEGGELQLKAGAAAGADPEQVASGGEAGA